MVEVGEEERAGVILRFRVATYLHLLLVLHQRLTPLVQITYPQVLVLVFPHSRFLPPRSPR
jgi:hypothetical protein